MAGIYVHIPYCHQACSYCDFHFTVYPGRMSQTINAILLEAEQKKDYLHNETISTVYFGGGTPSVVPDDAIRQILIKLKETYPISSDPEITLEANPDDITALKISNYRKMGINRISLGIQSFREADLKLLNRRHSAENAEAAILKILNGGFSNVSIDLIYGIPGLSIDSWKKNLEKTFGIGISHLSAYHLTYEQGTELSYRLKKNKIIQLTEKESLQQFNLLVRLAEKNGFIQYEISNFARNGHISKHNTGYWTGQNYIGLGPSAHSYNGYERQWNIKGIMTYCMKVNSGTGYFEKEVLDKNTMFNEYLLTSLRTKWGIALDRVRSEFGSDYSDKLMSQCEKHLKQDNLYHEQGRIILTKKGMFIADSIILDLFVC